MSQTPIEQFRLRFDEWCEGPRRMGTASAMRGAGKRLLAHLEAPSDPATLSRTFPAAWNGEPLSDFQGLRAAEDWCGEHGFAVGEHWGDDPIAVHRDATWTRDRWTVIADDIKANLDGQIRPLGDFETGGALLVFKGTVELPDGGRGFKLIRSIEDYVAKLTAAADEPDADLTFDSPQHGEPVPKMEAGGEPTGEELCADYVAKMAKEEAETTDEDPADAAKLYVSPIDRRLALIQLDHEHVCARVLKLEARLDVDGEQTAAQAWALADKRQAKQATHIGKVFDKLVEYAEGFHGDNAIRDKIHNARSHILGGFLR